MKIALLAMFVLFAVWSARAQAEDQDEKETLMSFVTDQMTWCAAGYEAVSASFGGAEGEALWQKARDWGLSGGMMAFLVYDNWDRGLDLVEEQIGAHSGPWTRRVVEAEGAGGTSNLVSELDSTCGRYAGLQIEINGATFRAAFLAGQKPESNLPGDLFLALRQLLLDSFQRFMESPEGKATLAESQRR